jgi:phospholipase C
MEAAKTGEWTMDWRMTAGVCAAALMHGAGAQAASLKDVRAHIQHVIIIMQENRSFDSYFGTFPGADGIPAGVCVPFDPANPGQGCVVPYHTQNDQLNGGPHGSLNGQADVDDGITTAKMDGFVQEAENAHQQQCKKNPNQPNCPGLDPNPDVMGYHTDAELPNYWNYARTFVLQDRLFEGVRSYTLDSHLDLTSEWTANCTDPNDQTTCVTTSGVDRPGPNTQYPWANLPMLLDTHGVSWKYYLGSGLEPDCDPDEMSCDPEPQLPGVGSLINPVPNYKYFRQQSADYQKFHNPDVDQFLVDIKNGTLPQVSWIVPQAQVGEHPRNGSSAGQDYVTSLINAVMQSPYWQNTAIFLAWDDWGGFYDHVEPPMAVYDPDDPYPVIGFGLRVPGIMISAWAKHGIDHQTLSFENYARFVEDLFMNKARLDPAALGLPDARLAIADSIRTVSFTDGHTEKVGDLTREFDFSKPASPPLVLSTAIPTHIKATCGQKKEVTCTDDTVAVTWESLTGPNVPTVYTYHLLQDGTELANCATTGTACSFTTTPGDHVYRLYSVDPSGTKSPLSAGAELVSP